jgi:serine/threonine-protein kinase RIO1
MFARIVTIVCPCPCFIKKDVLLEEVVVEDALCAYDLKEVVIEQRREKTNEFADMV